MIQIDFKKESLTVAQSYYIELKLNHKTHRCYLILKRILFKQFAEETFLIFILKYINKTGKIIKNLTKNYKHNNIFIKQMIEKTEKQSLTKNKIKNYNSISMFLKYHCRC